MECEAKEWIREDNPVSSVMATLLDGCEKKARRGLEKWQPGVDVHHCRQQDSTIFCALGKESICRRLVYTMMIAKKKENSWRWLEFFPKMILSLHLSIGVFLFILSAIKSLANKTGERLYMGWPMPPVLLDMSNVWQSAQPIARACRHRIRHKRNNEQKSKRRSSHQSRDRLKNGIQQLDY